MRRLKNIAEHLEAIFRKREKEQEKTLNLQSLEERVLYSAVPLPVDLADAVENPQEPADVSDLVPDTVEANVTSTFDQLDDLLTDDETPELSSTVSVEPLEGSFVDGSENQPQENVEAAEESEFIPRSADTPVAASIVVASPADPIAGGVGATAAISEGDVLQIQDTSLAVGGVSGQTLELLSLSDEGTLYQEGVELQVGDPISLTALENGDVLLIPDLNYIGNIEVEFERTSGGPADAADVYAIEVTVSGVADDGVAVLGDSLTPIGSTFSIASAGTDSVVAALDDADGGYVIVWTTTDANPEDRVVVGQRFNANGTTNGGTFTLDNGNGASLPQVAALSDGGFVVAFQDDIDDRADVYLQRFNSTGQQVDLSGGTPSPDSLPRLTPTNTEQSAPSIVGTSDGGFAVAYQWQDATGVSSVRLMMFDENGVVGDKIEVNGSLTVEREAQPQIVELEDGKLLVAWVDGEGTGTATSYDLVATILDPNGNTIDAPFVLSSVAPSGDFSIAATPSNGFAVAVDQEDGNRSRTAVIVFDENGAEIASEVGSRTDVSENPEIAVLDDGSLILGLHREGNGPSSGQVDVYFRRVLVDEQNGSLAYAEAETAAATKLVGDQRDIELAVLNNGRIVSVFESDGGISTQQALQTVTTRETNEVNLEISPLVFSTADGPVTFQSEDVLNVVLQGLPEDTKVLFDGSVIYTADGVNDINLNLQEDEIDKISLVAPDGFAGLLKGTLSVGTFHDGDQQTKTTDFAVVVTSPSLAETVSVGGIVAHDTAIDGSVAGDQGFEDVQVRLLERTTGQEFRVIDVTNTVNGNYSFTGLEDGKQYLVAVDSSTGELSTGNTWAQQTYSSTGGITDDFHNDLASVTATDGFLIGGANAAISDAFSAAVGDTIVLDGTIQHGVFFTASSFDTNLEHIDFGFSFDVVTHVSTDDNDAQGSFNQFLINANDIAGENRMRFVPGVPTASGEDWWTIEVDELLTAIRDDHTIIDGRAWQAPTDGGSGSLDPYHLIPNVVNQSFVGAVGVGADKLGDASQAEITALDSPDLEIVNASGGDLVYGLLVRPTEANPVLEGVEISNISIHGFGNGEEISGNIIVDGRGTASDGTDAEVSGISITGSVIGADPNLNSPVDVENKGNNISILSASGVSETSPNEISNNFIYDARLDGVYLTSPALTSSDATRNWLISDNVILDNGLMGQENGDGVSLGLYTTNISVEGNFISGSSDYGVDTERHLDLDGFDGSYLIRSNTITSNGEGSADSYGGGILLRSTGGSQVIGNSIVGNFKNGVDVNGSVLTIFPPFVNYKVDASSENLISMNEFGGNHGIGINLNQGSVNSANTYDGITLQDGVDFDSGNIGLDAPEIDNVTFANDQLVIEFDPTGPLADANNNGTFDQLVETIEVYVAAAGSGDSLGGESYGEGQSFIGSFQTSDLVFDDGKWKLTVDRPSFGWPDGDFLDSDSVTAISIDVNSNTSEFGKNAAINFAPDALPSDAQVLEEAEFTFAATDFLSHDRNEAAPSTYDRIRIDSLPPVSEGTLLLDGMAVTAGQEIPSGDINKLTFTGAQDFYGDAVFTFSVSDGNEFGSASTMTVEVLPVNDAPTTSTVTLAPALEDNDRTITEAELLANANDVEGDLLSASGLAIASGNGSLVDHGDGTWTYTPSADDDSEVSFTYYVTDSDDNVAGSATLDILPANDAPLNSAVTLSTVLEDNDRIITEAELLANASDVEGDTLSVSGLAIASGNGSLVDHGDGTWTYTPAADDDSAVSFTYDVTDGEDDVVGNATLDILPANDAPTNSAVTLAPALEDNDRTITEAELLANASDLEGDTLSVSALAIASGNGSVVDNLDGTWTYSPAADDDSGVVFSYNVYDGAVSVAGSATLDILPVNDAPTNSSVTLTPILEDGVSTISQAELLANASDVDGDMLSVSGLAIASGNGVLVDNGDSTWTYTATADDDSAVVFTYSVSDDSGSVAGSAALEISSVNDAPTNSAVTLLPVLEDDDRIIYESELLANANDVEGDVLSVVGLTITSGNGVLADNGDGTWTYSPAANDDSDVEFSYEVTDGAANVVGSATLDILPVDDSLTNSAVTLTPVLEDNDRTITEAELLANANDLEGDALSVFGLAVAAGDGSLADNGDGTWTYSPAADDDSVVSFSYSVTDGTNVVAGSASLDIVPVEDMPTNSVVTLMPSLLEDTDRVITETELLANADDVDGDALALSGLTIASGNGSLADNGDGTWTYTPLADDDSDVVFSYDVTDGANSVAGTATLDILPVNDRPTNSFVTLSSILEDNTRIITETELLENASDIEGDSLSVSGLSIIWGNGSLVDNGDRTWTYTPQDDDDLHVRFGYRVSDGESDVQGGARLDIVPVNDAPENSATTLVPVLEDADRIITEAELLANASDVEDDSLSVAGLDIASGNGVLVDNGDSTWTYTPAADDDSAVVFSYRVTDGTENVAGSAALDITPVNDVPTNSHVNLAHVVVNNDRVITEAELLANASDVEGDALSVSGLVIDSGNGSLLNNGDGTWTYSPATDDDSEVRFTYDVNDNEDSVAGSATLDIVPFNGPPTNSTVALTPVIEDTDRIITEAELLANATDVEGDTLSVSGVMINSGNGVLVNNGDSTWTYTPATDDDSNVSFNYDVTDGVNAVAGSATLDVLPDNDAPINTAVDLASVFEDSDRIITESELVANASDVENDTLSVTGLVIDSGNGILVDNGDSTWTYTPAADDDSGVSFKYDVTDGVDSVAGSATLDILPVNDAPTSSFITLSPALEDSTRVITQAELLANANDIDGDVLSVSDLQIASGSGNLADNGDGTWTYIPLPNDHSVVGFEYKVTDGADVAIGTAEMNILPVNDVPTSSEVTLTPILEDSGRVITEAELLANASDIEGDALTVNSLTISSANGSLVDNLDGTWTYTPAADDESFVTLEYNVSDGTDDVVGVATFDIEPVNDVPTLQQIPVLTASEGQPWAADVLTEGMAADVETDADDLSLVIVGGENQDWFFVNTETNQLEMVDGYIVPDGQDTDLEVVVAVDDRSDPNDGADDALHQSSPETVVVRVLNVNDAPVFDSPLDQETVAPDETFVTQVVATDQDGDNINFRLADPSDARFFEIDQTSGVLQFKQTPDFAFLGTAGESTLVVEVVAEDVFDAVSEQKIVSVSIPEFAVPPPQTVITTNDGDSSDDSDGSNNGEISGIDTSTLPPAGLQPGQTDGAGTGPRPNALLENRENQSGVDDFNYTGEGFVIAPIGSEVDLGAFESYYRGAGFIQETELISQQLADAYASRRGYGNVDFDDTQLAALFWQTLDSSNDDYLQRNFDADNAKLVAASAGLLSAGLLFAVYGGSIAITTLATQLPAWKSLDISPLISAFDEDEESIHEIVDG